MFLLIDKPKGMTSHDVVDEVRRITSERRVGHGGTLDPNATGLLVVGVGRESTKKLGVFTKGMDKTYEAEIYLGEERETDDVEGQTREIPNQARSSHVARVVRDDKSGLNSLQDLSSIEIVLASFVGKQKQIPPAYSSVKVGGRKAYRAARRGATLNLKPRNIEIYSIGLLSCNYPTIKIRTKVSSGTYIRALARDIGRKLGTGAYLKNLRRTRIGKFNIDNAVSLDKLTKVNWKDLTA